MTLSAAVAGALVAGAASATAAGGSAVAELGSAELTAVLQSGLLVTDPPDGGQYIHEDRT